VNTSKFRGSLTGGIAEATALALPGDEIVVDQLYLRLHGSVTFNKAGVRYRFLGTLDFLGNGDNGIVVSAPGVELRGVPGCVTIISPDYSGVLINAGADDCLLDGMSVGNYNVQNQNGAAAIFALPSAGIWINRLTVRNCHTLMGNGNGLRIGGVKGGRFEDSLFELTRGNSSEGVTVVGSDLYFNRVRVDKAQVTGILVWGAKASGAFNNITFDECVISNSSQAVLPSPLGQNQKGSNQAMQVNVNDGAVSGLLIRNCTAYDNQIPPTQDHFLDITGTTGTLTQLVFEAGNRAWGNINSVMVTNELPAAQMVNCQIPG
jgi:hypothetical protein